MMGKYSFNYNILDLIYIKSKAGLVSQIINFMTYFVKQD